MSGAETFRAPAEACHRLMGRYGPPLAAAFLDAVGIRAGMRALDVGCGPGVLTAALAGRLGDRSVAAVDPSEPLVAACRARLPEVDVPLAPAEALPFADETFDAALAQLVVNVLREAQAGVAEMARVTRAGGVVAACVWDYAGEMTLLRAFWDAAREVEPQRAAAQDEGVVMRWCAEGDLAVLWRAAAWPTSARAISWSARSTGFKDLWAPFPSGVGGGPFALRARAWFVVGTVPRW